MNVQRIKQNEGGRTGVGFVTHLVVMAITDVIDIVPNGLFVNSLELKAGKQAILFELYSKACTWQEVEQRSDDGKLFNITLDVVLTGQSATTLTWLYENQNKKFVLAWRDTNGNCFVAGDTELGFEYLYKRWTTDRSLMQVVFTANMLAPSFTLNTSFFSSVNLKQI